ncbi:unnamed protein product [Lactuca saligna]|uniref:Uncharacterized protein n=1 Tax=Lactuca saligna TaxID=75948 RepID=A0AA35ZWU3_LACSI|nr:unnamed protein product [Lactuca saligna]
MKVLGPNTFGLMKQSRKSAKGTFQVLKDVVKFGNFAETEGVQASSTPIAIVDEEHVTPSRSNISSSVEVSNDDDYDSNDIGDMSFCLSVPPKEPVNEVVIIPAETETEINIFRQPNILTPEQMDALIKELQSTARKPHQAVYVSVESPSEIDEGTFASGSSFVPPPPEHDVASIKASKILAFRDSIPHSESGKAPKTSERVVIRPAPDSNIDQHLSSGPATVEERREKQKKGFEVDKNMGVVKWSSELFHVPFHNPTNDPNAWAFKNFLEDKSRHKFASVSTASSFVRKVKGIIDPCTNKTMVNVMRLPTRKTKKIPLSQPIPDGSIK